MAEFRNSFGGKGEVSLRPEMTPTLARMVAARQGALPQVLRWFSIPQLFRYERQQRGRLREHFQWNVDIVGEESVTADAEVLAVAIDALRELGLGEEDFRARVSDRRLLSAVLRAAGAPGDRVAEDFALPESDGQHIADALVEMIEAVFRLADIQIAQHAACGGGEDGKCRNEDKQKDDVLDFHAAAKQFVQQDPLKHHDGLMFMFGARKEIKR